MNKVIIVLSIHEVRASPQIFNVLLVRLTVISPHPLAPLECIAVTHHAPVSHPPKYVALGCEIITPD